MSYDINLQNRQTKYGSNFDTASTSKNIDSYIDDLSL